MPNEAATQLTWIAKGRKFDKQLGLPGTNDDDIPIMEVTRSVGMDPGTEPYGKPIDANLAVHLMASLLKKLQEDLNLDFTKMSFSNMKENTAFALTAGGWLQQLLLVSFGMTFDKNIILKILSQPKCEGMRYYLCMKSVPDAAGGDPKEFLSLVLVGVDENGTDLHYESITLGNDIPTASLTAEYGHPPTDDGGGVRAFDERYVLLKLASELATK